LNAGQIWMSEVETVAVGWNLDPWTAPTTHQRGTAFCGRTIRRSCLGQGSPAENVTHDLTPAARIVHHRVVNQGRKGGKTLDSKAFGQYWQSVPLHLLQK
jgi:hypothetical protein